MANPMYGQNKYDDLASDVSNVKMKQFSIDFGIQEANTATTEVFEKGQLILGFSAVVTEAMTSGGSATIQLGFTGTTMLSAAVGKATAVADYPIGPDNSADAAPYVLVANDTFDSIVGTATATAGKVDVTVWYIDAPSLHSGVEYVTPAS
jgi:hypothetical protein|tara:strand:- start:2723 stop:3172 length:450 start_codon:yes stop_codon:yes gene_type:complete